ncbi:MAG TPA: sugar phosphate isomerase/epimerase family protein [Candidatus Hydrogenedentes bacterium]|mgnify:CR=1 FL=1|nr:sugar phosphate isomerase/epimerase family protein [Candidatus Hydrogenedentota bacterium]HQH53644.1 sugar phosphate isomerase/epimerase family protein [Candidatus Hydrogenedentota bacterium]HQM48503.1 sugar phosphate isomerase/epimerase family protein [Candidatus Hydrogenedentota bacterium]
MTAERFPAGAQSYSFRKFDTSGAIECLKKLGADTMEFCAVHFPPDAGDAGFAGVKEMLAARKMLVPCFGVEGFSDNAAANRKKFEFAKALGVQVLTADPTPEAFDNLEELVEEFQIKIAIHNHGPGARYDKVADTLKAVRGRHPYIGACVDTGHHLRSNEQPHEVLEQLGDRVISLHLKDWAIGGEEQLLGEGDMDLVAVAKALLKINFTGPIVMEYEESPENPVPDMKKGLANWRAAVKAAGA